MRYLSSTGREDESDYMVTGSVPVFPVEYKKGEPKESEADILKLTAQASVWSETSCRQD